MKKCMILALVVCLLLAACGCEELIGEAKAIDIALAEAEKYADTPITKDMAACEYVTTNGDPCYEVTFDAKTEETLGFCVIVIVRVDPESGEILEVMEAA